MKETAPAASPSGLSPYAEQLLAARTVLIFGEISCELAELVTTQLLALASRGAEPIRVLLHSPGGHVESADTIFDMIRFITPEVRILATGWVASAGSLIYVAAEKEARFSLPNTRFLLHQPLGGVGGRASDIEIEAAQILAIRERLNGIYAEQTGQTLERIKKDTERNHWLTAREAIGYGLVGRIIESAAEL
jgi:ATP-dependent Clp protease protease subunit